MVSDSRREAARIAALSPSRGEAWATGGASESEAPQIACFHCGDALPGEGIRSDGKAFCCAGCRAVYEILRDGNLCTYYTLEKKPGIAPVPYRASRFAYLEDPSVRARMLDFSSGGTSAVSLTVPSIHCSSCIWLLENLHRLNGGILQSRVDFLKKRLSVRFREEAVSLRAVVELLTSLGYEPEITLDALEGKQGGETRRGLYYRVGVAAFAFGNIMLLSFPEYLAPEGEEVALRPFFGALNVLLSLPVVFYSASGYFTSAVVGLRRGIVNIEVPIALGIAIVFARSLVEILSGTGAGFMDSLSGLVFFLLLGKLYQSKTYDALNFERKHTSYLPIAVTVREKGVETTIPVTTLGQGQRILIHSNEIVPADAVLMSAAASIDYSFVTGESVPVPVRAGDLVYAGGRQTGPSVELEVVREVSRSRFLQLWNESPRSGKPDPGLGRFSTIVARYFTGGVLVLAAGSGVYWFFAGPERMWDAVTGVLIVACPCALALSIPFAHGTVMRIFGRRGFYLKNAGVIETLAGIDTVVFDKTGTITQGGKSDVRFEGGELPGQARRAVSSLLRHSTHPLSRAVRASLGETGESEVEGFREVPGSGIEAMVGGMMVRVGSREFAGAEEPAGEKMGGTRVHVSLDGVPAGCFAVSAAWREGLKDVIGDLGGRYSLALISGDADAERPALERIFPKGTEMRFAFKPDEKLRFVRDQQGRGRRVLMIGDGLNDAGALLQADAGVSVTDQIGAFAPACDAILDAGSFPRLGSFLSFSRTAMRIVYASFAISILYNVAGLFYALQGVLSPLVAAILMPASSVTVVAFTTLSARVLAGREEPR
ncbi:MAG: heavy metal translocating P-type ATPase metal-binding domain-containing protein [Bacteroidota bacterium]